LLDDARYPFWPRKSETQHRGLVNPRHHCRKDRETNLKLNEKEKKGRWTSQLIREMKMERGCKKKKTNAVGWSN